MNQNKISKLISLYETSLFEDVLPFWEKYSPDEVYGGLYNYLNRDGSLLSTDKSVWIICRQLWTYSCLYNNFDKKEQWLNTAKNCYDFIQRCCFDKDGRMFFQVTKEGAPLRKRRYWFTETFCALGFSEYATAAGSAEVLQQAKEVYDKALSYYENPESFEAKIIPETRALAGHVAPMLLFSTAQNLRSHDPENKPYYDTIIEKLYNTIFSLFVKKDRKVLLETVGADGKIIEDIAQCRIMNPGHAIEEAWFLLTEGEYREDDRLIHDALDIMEWSLEIGWDNKYGGIFYFTDMNGLPPSEIVWDNKYWWPHTEAVYGLLYAYYLTREKKYETWFDTVQEWTFEHFPDPEYGGWYGYLHRDGSILLPIKGSDWKSSFHTARMLMFCIKLLERMKNENNDPY